jgi:hypothetical protein
MNMRFGIWNVRNLYRAGSLRVMTVANELSEYNLDLVGVREVRWKGGAPNQQVNTHFSTERGMRTMTWVQVLLSRRESYQQLRG